jgi:hypothetical protein
MRSSASVAMGALPLAPHSDSTKDGRRRGPADTATLRPVNPQVRPALALRPTFGCVPAAEVRVLISSVPTLFEQTQLVGRNSLVRDLWLLQK